MKDIRFLKFLWTIVISQLHVHQVGLLDSDRQGLGVFSLHTKINNAEDKITAGNSVI